MSYNISGIQQIGVGVADIEAAWAWYRKYFGMDVPVFREAAEAALMARYTGGEVHSRDAVLALNLQGGSGMEIWQFTSRTPNGPFRDAQLGDTGIFAARIKTPDVHEARRALDRFDDIDVGAVARDPAGHTHFVMRDLAGNHFDVVESDSWFARGRHFTGGPSGCLMGVSSIDFVIPLYSEILGYDRVDFDETGTFDDLQFYPGGSGNFRRVLLSHTKERSGPFSPLFGSSQIELIQAVDRTPGKLFDGRYWGDLGFIHLCFDVNGMDALESACEQLGYAFTVDSKESFDMGEAAGRFSYIEDPDGTLIEFVETHRVPILKKVGWYLDLRKRPATKPLPRWMIKSLAMSRVGS